MVGNSSREKDADKAEAGQPWVEPEDQPTDCRGVAGGKDARLVVDSWPCTIDYNPCEVRPGEFGRE